MTSDLSREENKKSTEVPGFLFRDEKKKKVALLCPTSWQSAQVNRESLALLVKGVDFKAVDIRLNIS